MKSIGLTLALAAAVTGWAWAFQRPLTYNGGLGWDGAQYVQLATQCGRQRMQALEPFVYRVGAPCLAALLPVPPKYALWAINVGASIGLLLLLSVWLRRHVADAIVPWLIVFFAAHWLSPLRYTWWYPTYVDPLALCAMVAALLAQHRRWLFVAVCVAGAAVRETMIVVPLSLLAGALIGSAAGRQRRDAVVTAAAGVLACAAAALAIRAVVTPASDYWMLDAAYYWTYEKPLPRYLLAAAITFGPIGAVVMAGRHAAWLWIETHRGEALIVAMVLVLAWVGGSDTERFMIWAMPVVLVLAGRAAATVDWKRHRLLIGVLVAAAALNGRWLLPTPDFVEHVPRAWPLLTPVTAASSDLLFSQTPDQLMSAVALLQYLALLAGLWVWLARAAGRQPSEPQP
jgi:hypothetical protein